MALLVSISSTYASTNDASAMYTEQDNASKVTQEEDLDSQVFKQIMVNSRFYTLLLSLSTEVPDLTRVAEYVMLINEIHRLNKNLTLITEALQNANSIHENRYHEGELHG